MYLINEPSDSDKFNNQIDHEYMNSLSKLRSNCPACGIVIRESMFRSKQDVKESTLSGLCQNCIDVVFGIGDL